MKKISIILLLSFMLILISCSSKKNIIVKVKNISGNVSIKLFGETQFNKINKEKILSEFDEIKTTDNSSCDIEFPDGSIVKLDYKTTIKISSINSSFKKSSIDVLLTLLKGSVLAKVNKRDSKFEIESENAVAGVRGTEFIVLYESPTKTKILVLEGSVYGFKQSQANEADRFNNVADPGYEIIVYENSPVTVQKANTLAYSFRGKRLLGINENSKPNMKIHNIRNKTIKNK